MRHEVQVWKEVMVGTTGGHKFASVEKIIVPLESVQRDESKCMLSKFHEAEWVSEDAIAKKRGAKSYRTGSRGANVFESERDGLYFTSPTCQYGGIR